MKKSDIAREIVGLMTEEEVDMCIIDLMIMPREIFFKMLATLIINLILSDDETGHKEEEYSQMLQRFRDREKIRSL